MALKQYEINSILAAIREFIKANTDRAANAGVLLAQAIAALVGLATTYSSFVANLNADAVATPSDGVFQCAKEAKDKCVAEFNATKTEVGAKLATIQGV